ncbi:MAG: hypothetical protein OHK0013_17550 [Sandaracinaceae bacterium]
MSSWPGAPLAAAVELLALEGRGASGVIGLGPRRLLMRRGRVAGVSRLTGEPSLAEFLVASGRMSDGTRARLAEEGLGDDALEHAVSTADRRLVAHEELPLDMLREALRSVWLERLVRAFGTDAPAHVLRNPAATPPEGTHDVSTLALVLDALERLAATGDAEIVGQRAQQWIRFGTGPAVPRAKRWAQIEAPREVRVATVLSGSPAAAPRIAALARAGFLEILPGANQGPPPPPAPAIRRASSRPPPPRAGGSIPPPTGDHGRVSVAPPRAARVVLAPGAAPVAWATELPAFAPDLVLGDRPLADPLDAAEDQVAALEAAGAPAPLRARAWRIVAEVARERLGALDEYARAAREAAAADPTDPDGLRRAADACAAIEEVELALAYGKAVIAVAQTQELRARALHEYALLCHRLGRREEALQAARAATQLDPESVASWMLVGELELALDRRSDAAVSFGEAASLAHAQDPARAHLLAARSYRACPKAAHAVEQLSASLARAGLHAVAVELRAERARIEPDRDERRRLLLVAAERAESHGTPLASASLLLAAFDTDPSIDVVWEPLVSDLLEAGAQRERAIVLEEIAREAREDAGEWWVRAADARAALEPDGSLELELRTRALVELPGHGPTLEALRTLADRTGHHDAYLAALDRAIRGARATGGPRKHLATLLASEADRRRRPTLAAWASEVAQSGQLPAPRRAEGPWTAARVEAAAFDPPLRVHAIAAARAALEAGGSTELCRALLVAARAEGDDAARAHAQGWLAAHATGPIERARLRVLEAAFASFGGDRGTAAMACRDAASVGHADAELGIRLRRALAGTDDATTLATAWAAEAAHAKGPLRARALAELACIEEARGRFGSALDLAMDALREDPACARAALVFLRRDRGALDRERLGPDLAAHLRELLGDVPETLRALARASADPAEALACTVRWAALDPVSPEPIFTSLELSERHDLPEYDDAALDALVSAPRCEPTVLDPVLRAIDRIAARDPRRALERALLGAAALGPAGHVLRARAFEIALAHQDHDGLVRAAESQLASPAGDRVAALRRIASLRREGGDLAGEARTWLRLLALAPRDDEALHRLAAIYAATGERERLVATLSLRVEEGASAHERAVGHLELAAVHARTLGEPEAALRHLEAAEAELTRLDEASSDEDGSHAQRRMHLGRALVVMGRVERGIEILLAEARRARPDSAVGFYEAAISASAREAGGAPRALQITEEALERCGMRGKLLLAFEHLALDLGDLATAERVYARLVQRAAGAHGRRALLYRRARWLERVGAHREALDAYVEACQHQASSGALLASLERLARAQGELESLARGLRSLSENAPHPTVRLALLRRAASLLSTELSRPRAALEMLSAEWLRTFASDLEPDLARETARTAAAEPTAARETVAAMVAEIERRAADAWMGEERAHLLRKAARLYASGLGDLEAAEAYVLRAVQALEEENAEKDALRAPIDELAELYRAAGRTPPLASWLARLERPAADTTTPGATIAPEESAAQSATAPEAAPVPETTSEPVPAPETTSAEEPEPAAAPPTTSAKEPEPAAAPPTTSAKEPEPVPQPTSAAVRPTRSDWAPAPAPERPSRAEEGSRVSFVADPRRIVDLVATAEQGSPAARRVARRILAACDASAGEAPLPLEAGPLMRTSLDFFRHAGLADALALLRRIWENGLPLFKRTTRDLGILGTDRVGAHDATPLGRAVQSVARLLSLSEPLVYQTRDRSHRGAEVLRTVPPSVRVSEALARSPAALRFELARALELATPERVLVASLAPAEGRNLFAAIRAAFGPAEPAIADGRSAARNRDTAVLAADLWSTLPPLAQKAVRELLVAAGDTFDHETVSAAVEAGAVRVGLVACGDPRTAVLRVFARDPALVGREPRDLEALADALERSPLLQDLVRFALSDGFVDACAAQGE